MKYSSGSGDSIFSKSPSNPATLSCFHLASTFNLAPHILLKNKYP